MERKDTVWQSEALAKTFVENVRGGIPFATEQIDVMLRLIAANGSPVQRFIDLGCGSGVLAAAILAHYPAASGVLVDFSEPMLAQARDHLGRSAADLRFVLADFGVKAWLDHVAGQAPFDVIVSGYAIHHQPDARKQELYGELFGLLRPGGLFVNVEHVASPTQRIETMWDELMADSLYAFHVRQGTGKSHKQITHELIHRPDKAANILAPVERQCDWLRDLGFQDVDCYFKVFELAVFGGRRPASDE
jgi:tRNA (cmo5U34)-methyltransferase